MKHLWGRKGLPELEPREKTPSSFPLKIEYLMLSWIDSGAKAFIVTIEVPVKIKKRILGKENSETNKSKHWVVIICLLLFLLAHSANDYWLRVFHKPDLYEDIVTNKIDKISVFLLVINRWEERNNNTSSEPV